MRKHLAAIGIATLLISTVAKAQSTPELFRTFDLGVKRTPAPQFFVMESKFMLYARDGKRIGTDVYRLRLKSNPAQAGKDGDEYTCARFTWQPQGGVEAAIPALTDWSYVFKAAGDKGQMFGIDSGKFERLADSNGKTLPADKGYHVYNAFIDFHSFCNVFADRAAPGRGIQDLKKVGDKIVHAAAFSKPPVNSGESFFENGEITLELKGLSQVNGRACALVGYDSGESSFKMQLKGTQTAGSSHYFGDIYKDLANGWVQRATMTEIVVSETTVATPPNKVNAVVERAIDIRNVSEKEFGM
ncbi:MAG TPA: hypothetical protein VK615_07380 [Candidatus Binatia bacterium]|nr:hypothetical protein [Candidatus Binatia bacterium]